MKALGFTFLLSTRSKVLLYLYFYFIVIKPPLVQSDQVSGENKVCSLQMKCSSFDVFAGDHYLHNFLQGARDLLCYKSERKHLAARMYFQTRRKPLYDALFFAIFCWNIDKVARNPPKFRLNVFNFLLKNLWRFHKYIPEITHLVVPGTRHKQGFALFLDKENTFKHLFKQISKYSLAFDVLLEPFMWKGVNYPVLSSTIYTNIRQVDPAMLQKYW